MLHEKKTCAEWVVENSAVLLPVDNVRLDANIA